MLVCAELGLRPIMMLSVTDAHAESTVTVGASEGCQDEGDEASDRRGWLHHLMEAGAAVAAAEPLNPLQLGLIMHEPVLPEEIGLVALTAEPILPSEAGLVIPSIEPLLPEAVGLVVPSDGPALPSEVGLIVPHSLRFDEWTDFSPLPRLPEEEELDFAASTHVRGNCSIEQNESYSMITLTEKTRLWTASRRCRYAEDDSGSLSFNEDGDDYGSVRHPIRLWSGSEECSVSQPDRLSVLNDSATAFFAARTCRRLWSGSDAEISVNPAAGFDSNGFGASEPDEVDQEVILYSGFKRCRQPDVENADIMRGESPAQLTDTSVCQILWSGQTQMLASKWLQTTCPLRTQLWASHTLLPQLASKPLRIPSFEQVASDPAWLDSVTKLRWRLARDFSHI